MSSCGTERRETCLVLCLLLVLLTPLPQPAKGPILNSITGLRDMVGQERKMRKVERKYQPLTQQ